MVIVLQTGDHLSLGEGVIIEILSVEEDRVEFALEGADPGEILCVPA